MKNLIILGLLSGMASPNMVLAKEVNYDCSKAAKQAVQAIIGQNAKRLGSEPETIYSVKLTKKSAHWLEYTVSTQLYDSTYEWKVESSLNCQISKVESAGGL